MEFIVSVHVKNSEKHKNKIPLLKYKAKWKTCIQEETPVLSDWQINIKQSCHCHENNWFWESPTWQLVRQYNQAACEQSLLLSFSLLRRMLQLTTQQLCQGNTQTLSCWTSTLQLARQKVGQKMLQMKPCWTLWTTKN